MSENQEKDEIIWDEEVDRLSESGNGVDYFTPEEGQTKIKFLDNGTEYTDQKKFDDEPRDYVVFRIEVDGEEYKWDMSKGSTPGSKFGQIARYAAAKGGLEDETITWFRQGEGQQTNHVLMDLSNMADEDSDEDSDEEETLFGDDDEENDEEDEVMFGDDEEDE